MPQLFDKHMAKHFNCYAWSRRGYNNNNNKKDENREKMASNKSKHSSGHKNASIPQDKPTTGAYLSVNAMPNPLPTI